MDHILKSKALKRLSDSHFAHGNSSIGQTAILLLAEAKMENACNILLSITSSTTLIMALERLRKIIKARPLIVCFNIQIQFNSNDFQMVQNLSDQVLLGIFE